jgi:hypothetical protein
MKKSLFFALIACVALVFVGCEPKVQPTDYIIKLSADELTLENGASEKLTAVVTPTSTYTLVWTSSNPEVATVNASGIIEAVGLGTTTITVTLNTPAEDPAVGSVTPATCVVNVTNDAVLNNFALGGYGLFGNPSLIAGTDTVLELSVGPMQCQLGYISLYAWDENIVFVSGSGFSGSGQFLMVDMPVYWITEEGPYQGYYIGNKEGFFVDTLVSDIDPYVAEAGQMTDVQMYGDGWKGMLNAETNEEFAAAKELYEGCHNGAQFIEMSEGQLYIYKYANVSFANIYDDEETEELRYTLKLEWYDYVNTDRFYGLACITEEDEEGNLVLASLVEPYDLRVIHKEYTNIPTEEEEEPAEASVLKPMKKNLYLGQNPVPATMDTKIMYKK